MAVATALASLFPCLLEHSEISLLSTPIVLIFLYYANRQIRGTYIDFEHRRSKGALRSPDPDERHVVDVIASLSEQMTIRRDVRLWIADDDPGVCPSVFEMHGLVHLVTPVTFPLLAKIHPLRARAMLAHELSHILQGDADLWPICHGLHVAISYIAPLYCLMFAVMDLVSIVLLFQTIEIQRQLPSYYHEGHLWDFVKLFVVPVVILWRLFRELKKRQEKVTRARITSEVVADIAAVRFVNADALLDALTQHVKNDTSSQTHPQKSERIAGIKKHHCAPAKVAQPAG
jgi:hypothetical protein